MQTGQLQLGWASDRTDLGNSCHSTKIVCLAENGHLCLQNVGALGAATVLIQGAVMQNKADCSPDFICRVILRIVMMLLEQPSSQRL